MAEKVLVTIELDVWNSAEPAVRVEEIIRETNKCIFLYRNVHPRGYYSSSLVENRQVTVPKGTLGIRSAGPGRMKALMLLPEQPDVREDPNFKEAMKVMLDCIATDLARAENRLWGIGGMTNLQRIRGASEDEIVDFIDDMGPELARQPFCVPELEGCEDREDYSNAPCKDCIRRWLHEPYKGGDTGC